MLPAIFATPVATKQIRIMFFFLGGGGGGGMENNKLLKVPTLIPKTVPLVN